MINIEKIRADAKAYKERGDQRIVTSGPRNKKLNVEEYLKQNGVDVKEKKREGNCNKYILHHCVFDESHTGKDAAIFEFDDGRMGYHCFHDSCSDKHWKDARQVISGTKHLHELKFSNKQLVERINATEDINVLMNVAHDAQTSGLSQTECYSLLKTIAKKIGVPVRTLQNDLQDGEDNSGKLYRIDHLEVAKMIVSEFGRENLAFVYRLNIVRRWNGLVWIELDDRTLYQAISNFLYRRTEGVTKNLIESITDLIRTDVYREDVIWDADTGMIPIRNGELEWNNGMWNLNQHVREHYRTTLIPVEYNPQARATMFEQYLNEVFAGDPDAPEKSILICEMIGYTLTTSCIYEKFILLIGPGANGKSVLLDLIRILVGNEQVSAVQPSQMDNKFQRAHLCGKLANIVTEIKEGGDIADAALKAIVSGELMTGEHKFKPVFDFRPFCTCWFGTNHMPHTRDFSDALFRRALIVEFNRVFQEHEQDKNLKRKLATELPGILNLALKAFSGVIQRGEFTIPESCLKAKEQWRLEADQAAQFVQDCCVMESDARVTSAGLYKAYQGWAQAAGIRHQLSKIDFLKRIELLGGKQGRESGARLRIGIRLAAPDRG
ncbi:MAG: phage/plasmid primase, P4 family [Salinivirgaceae bacterium]|nr:phage/plasmid primase, P4 family [Salinivirgaceae bacterium]